MRHIVLVLRLALGVALATFALATSAGCGTTTDTQADEPTGPPAASSATDAELSTAPERLPELSPALASCSSQRGSCIGLGTCRALGGIAIGASGCTSTQVCCVSECTFNGGSCTGLGTCRAIGGTAISAAGCASTQVCCVPP